MNPRIKLLAEQAFDKANNGTISDIKIPKEFIEKFAELIVRECANWVNNNLGLVDEEARADLLKHFGVEL
tara:strand:+ start:272 stop:481 length:210 start_codon:yes stop_codon:yes gene_type:complete